MRCVVLRIAHKPFKTPRTHRPTTLHTHKHNRRHHRGGRPDHAAPTTEGGAGSGLHAPARERGERCVARRCVLGCFCDARIYVCITLVVLPIWFGGSTAPSHPQANPPQNNSKRAGTFRNYKYAADAVYHSGLRPDVVYQYEDAPGKGACVQSDAVVCVCWTFMDGRVG